jgi:formylglycine-generating enzyme required for sulfatase activity
VRPFVSILVAAIVLLEGGCRRQTQPVAREGNPPVPTATSVQVAAGSGRRAGGEKANETLAIPPGRFFAGSVPGDDGRDPTIEPLATAYDLPAFSIDALPYPGKPGEPPRTGVTQAEAAKLCAEKSARLCTELEWERACRGPNGDLFAAGPAWDPTCSKTPEQCVSGFGARSMGASIQEWTASVVPSAEGPRKVAVRGAFGGAAAAAHRCAARHAMDPTVSGRPIGFRCCTGAAPSVSLASIESAPTFR